MFRNLAEMFVKNAEKYNQKCFYMFKVNNQYQEVTYGEFFEKVSQLAGGLKSLGLTAGDKVIILSENRLEWALVDYACQLSGLVSVPIYPTLLPEHIEYIINNSDARIVFVSNSYQEEKVSIIQQKLPQVKFYYQFQGEECKITRPFTELLELGKDYNQKNPQWWEAISDTINPDDVATIIYTSGTTGEPKGVMLTHKNFLSNIEGALKSIHVSENDVFLSFLPLSHVFERMAGHYLPCYCGATIAYAESIDTVAQNLQEIKPTVMTSVPRFYEKIYARINESILEGSPVKRAIFKWSLKQGQQMLKYRQAKRKPGSLLKVKFNLAKKLVFNKLKERVGGRIRFFVSGGAPLAKEIGEFFAYANLLILEGYGLTETSPVISVNREDAFKFGTVGLPLVNVEVKIAEDGEILTRGPHVMKGYYKKEEDTREVIDQDGWFHTGDIGYIDKDGFLVITDRKKNIIVTSGGKNVAPQPIENLLITSRYIEQAVVVGNARKYCTALIVPNMELVKQYARENYIDAENEEELLHHPMIKELIRKEIDLLSVHLASYETIKDFQLLKNPFTIESGELTPTLKVKRNVIEKKYKDLIDKMYPEF